ncbi:hypothetical protein OS493_033685 [Desmophyllum pertusum]|uniref:Uncharacterized protein n=1 Tax=Desmophyllum pertusum TaxID=174260 RepID=A0A9W9ZM87_9CNID|nr:hypothetical protein OS493_033685 [Desmophyllum pertusum]
MHEDIVVPLKKRKDEALIIATELKDLKAEFEKKKKELEDKASTKRSWAIGLAFIPFVGAIAGPALAASADSDLADAIAKGSQAKIQEAAAITVSEVPIPALEAFIDGIRKAAGFFSLAERELRKFKGEAEGGLSDLKYLYYKVMNKEARSMKSISAKSSMQFCQMSGPTS